MLNVVTEMDLPYWFPSKVRLCETVCDQTLDFVKERGQTLECLKKRGQTLECVKECGQTRDYVKDRGQLLENVNLHGQKEVCRLLYVSMTPNRYANHP